MCSCCSWVHKGKEFPSTLGIGNMGPLGADGVGDAVQSLRPENGNAGTVIGPLVRTVTTIWCCCITPLCQPLKKRWPREIAKP